MINIPNPNSKKWTQSNDSDVKGNVHITKNISFDEHGYLNLSNSPRSIMNELLDTDFNNPSSIIFDGSSYIVQTWEEPFLTNSSGIFAGLPTQITTANYPAGTANAGSDWAGPNIVFSENTDVTYGTEYGAAWTDTNISLTSGTQHDVVYMPNIPAVAIANATTVTTYQMPMSATPIAINTLTIPADYFTTGMCYFNQNLFVATRNRYGGSAYIYVWNGLTTAAQQLYKVDSNFVFDIVTHDNTVYALTGRGSLIRYTGGSFAVVENLPIFYTDFTLTDYANIGIYKGGMVSNGELLYMQVHTNSASKRLIDQPDGIWCYDKKVGLYHRYSTSMASVNSELVWDAEVNLTTDVITVVSAPVTGTEVYFKKGNGITPLVDYTKYFVIKLTGTTIKLATTKANALAGTAIDLTAVGGGVNTFIFFPNIDFGATFSYRTFSTCLIERNQSKTAYGADVLWGAEVAPRTISGGDANLISTSTGVEARGYIVTPKVFSTNVTDTYNQLTLKFQPFKSELDKIIIKYRNIDDGKKFFDRLDSVEVNATWTSTTTFTTEADLSNSVAGDEVEFMLGAAGGMLAHIVSISDPVAGVYTVTIDEAFDNYVSGDKSWISVRNWIKLETIAYGDDNATNGFYSQALGAVGKFIQFKIELRGIKVQIEELLVDNISHLPAKK